MHVTRRIQGSPKTEDYFITKWFYRNPHIYYICVHVNKDTRLGMCDYMCFSVNNDFRQNLPLNPRNMSNEYGDTEAIK